MGGIFESQLGKVSGHQIALTFARLPLECNPAVIILQMKCEDGRGSSLHHMLHPVNYVRSAMSERTHRSNDRAICFSTLNRYVYSTAEFMP